MGEAIKGYSYTFSNITASATTTLCTGTCFLGSVIINTAGGAETITIYDNTTSTGTLVGTIALPTLGMSFPFNCMLKTGLTVKNVSTTGNFTVTYAKA